MARSGSARADRSGSPDIWVVDAAGTTDPDPLLVEPGDEGSPAWSPDWNSIAFRSNRGGNLEIYVMTSDGDDVERLTETEADERAPSWSADGSKILFHSNRDGDMDLWVMNPNGTERMKITRTTNSAPPSDTGGPAQDVVSTLQRRP